LVINTNYVICQAKATWGRITSPVFLNLSTKYDERSYWRFGRFTSGEGAPGHHHHWIRGRVGPEACLDTLGQSKISRRRLNQDFLE